jgi:hypothetical protein
MASHRRKDRRKPVRSGARVSVFGISVTFQNNSLGWLGASWRIIRWHGAYRQTRAVTCRDLFRFLSPVLLFLIHPLFEGH